MDSGSVNPGPHLAPRAAPTPCFSTQQVTPCLVTPVSRVNASFSTQQVTPCLVTPVSRVKAPHPHLSTQQVTPHHVAPVSRVNTPEAPALLYPSPQSGPIISSTTSNPSPGQHLSSELIPLQFLVPQFHQTRCHLSPGATQQNQQYFKHHKQLLPASALSLLTPSPLVTRPTIASKDWIAPHQLPTPPLHQLEAPC